MSLVQVTDDPRGFRVLTLNRPDKLNALSGALIADLTAAALDCARNSALRAVILESSTPKAFCAGADLAERKAMNDSQVSDALASLRKLMDAVAAIPVPTIAALEGIAFGGGLELALACDLRVCATEAQMGLTETKLAIIPGAGGTQRLTRLVGEARAKELIFLARALKGPEALAYGLVQACVSDPRAQARQWTETLLAHGPLALVQAKKAIEGGADLPLAKGLDWERGCYEVCLKSQDRVEGLAAFSEKRKANYQAK